jgi:GT2 family glycosyltransferase
VIDTSRVTVSVVSHGQGAMVQALVKQLAQHCPYSIEKVIVTLNLSEDLPEEWVLGVDEKAKLPFAVELLRNDQPKGFGANHNQAFAHCATPWFAVMNPDIEVSGDVFSTLVDQAQTGAGLISPMVQEPGRAKPTPERRVITPWEVATHRRRPVPEGMAPVWFPGMFMLFRQEAFAHVAGFDEGFHMYCEDFDICARLHLAGIGLQRNHAVTVIHHAQRDSHARVQYLVCMCAVCCGCGICLGFGGCGGMH